MNTYITKSFERYSQYNDEENIVDTLPQNGMTSKAVPTREEVHDKIGQPTAITDDVLEKDQEIADASAEQMSKEYIPAENFNKDADILKNMDISDAINYAIKNKQVMKIWYKPLGRANTKDPKRLRREDKLRGVGTIGEIWRIVEPHYRYTAETTGNDLAVVYDRSVRAIRAYVISRIPKYEFLMKKKNTEEDQISPSVFKPRKKIVMPNQYGNKTMSKKIENLVKVASYFEANGESENSNIIKNAYSAIKNFKIAQYVGVQGYWLRNRRCWDNCYRHKRTTKPETPVQEIWTDCWEEYKKSINNDNSGWEKYASNDTSIKLSKSEYNAWNKLFIEEVEKKVENNISLPIAIYATINEESKDHHSKALEGVSNLLKIAEELKDSGEDDLSSEVFEVASDILKEAQFQGNQGGFWSPVKRLWEGLSNKWTGKGTKTDVIKKLQNALKKARDILTWINQGTRVSQAECSGNRKVVVSQKYNTRGPRGQFVKNTPVPTTTPVAPQQTSQEELKLSPEVENKGRGEDYYQHLSDMSNNKTPAMQPKNKADQYRGLFSEYSNFIKDVGSLANEFATLQNSKDTDVSFLTKNTLPVLHGVMGLEQGMVNTSGKDRVQLLRSGLQNFITDLTDAMSGKIPVNSFNESPSQNAPAVSQINDIPNPSTGTSGDASWNKSPGFIDPIETFVNSLNTVPDLQRASNRISKKIQQLSNASGIAASQKNGNKIVISSKNKK